ncbi:hypothetical protein JYU34_010292 [Plutella xylostella]|uniref:Uncharacterized protein n=1 Tax=Plutella xylostella TaxID=51655 RepID=A0ABQ7QI83_PLUXY|nr:hypothetical protein JYU34_010292 [Plutella xylostella]
MHSATRIAVSAFLITSALATTYQSSAKLRRDGVLSLYPFPRVGRGGRAAWQLPDQFYLDTYKPEQKRQLYAFPRVGRSDVPFTIPQLQSRDPEPYPDAPLSRETIRNIVALMVGRGRGQYGVSKRGSESTDSTSMWFGPRLGRAMKSEDDDITVESQNKEQTEPELADMEMMEERKKRQAK